MPLNLFPLSGPRGNSNYLELDFIQGSVGEKPSLCEKPSTHNLKT